MGDDTETRFAQLLASTDGVTVAYADARAGTYALDWCDGDAHARVQATRRRWAPDELGSRVEAIRAFGAGARELIAPVSDADARCAVLEVCRTLARSGGRWAWSSSHPNVAPLCAWYADDDEGTLTTFEPLATFTLASCVRHGMGAFAEARVKSLAAYQIVRAMAHAHEKGFALGGSTRLKDVHLCTLSGGNVGVPFVQLGGIFNSSRVRNGRVNDAARRVVVNANVAVQNRVEDRDEEYIRGVTSAWRLGAMSNLDYIMALNELAGRGKDRAYYTVAPWVIDFTSHPFSQEDDGTLCGARDLSKTKWRLTKGDAQLDFTYAHTEPPHHVSDDCLSELGACVALARRTPRATLARVVRAKIVAEEYPATLTRLYAASPDEAPIDFYTNPDIFTSVHDDMKDLELPPWACGSAQAFIKTHREAFECARVSERLHLWIDLTFGCATRGRAAVEAKNVMVRAVDPSALCANGRVCLFTTSHPKRSVSGGKVPRPMTTAGADASSISTSTIFEPSFKSAQERDLRALGQIIGAIYAGTPCPERDVIDIDGADGLFGHTSPMKPSHAGLFADAATSSAFTAWLRVMPTDTRDVVQLLMHDTKPVAASAVRDSVLFSSDIRASATALGKMRAASDDSATRLMVADESMKAAASRAVSACIMRDIASDIIAYVSTPRESTDTEDMRVAMCLASFVETACGRLSRRDVCDALVPIVVRALRTPSARLDGDGPTLKRELLHPNVLRAMRRAIGTAEFHRELVPALVSCLQFKHASREELDAVIAALVDVARSAPLPVTISSVVRVLRAALTVNRGDTRSGAHVVVADALSAVAQALGERAGRFALHVASPSMPDDVLSHLDGMVIYAGDSEPWSWLMPSMSFDMTTEDDFDFVDADAGVDGDGAEDEHHQRMSRVLRHASATHSGARDPWRVHLCALTSWRAHGRTSHAMTASADERLLATVGIASRVSKTNAIVRVWRAGGSEREGRGTLVEYTGHEHASATACAFINTAFDAQGDVSRIASCDDKGSVQLWKCCTGERAWQFRDNASGGFSCLSSVDEMSVVIAGGANASVVMADINAGRVTRTFACPSGHGVSAVSSGVGGGDANTVYASNRDGYVCAFDARTSGERPIFDVKAHDGQISKIIAPTSGASRAFITASADMTLALWDSRMIAATLDSKTRYDGRVRTFRGHRSAVRDVALGPNNDVVFSVAGSSVGVCSLAAASADDAEESRVVTFTPLNIETDDERAVLAPPPRGAEHHLAVPSSEFCALTVLPASRLFAVLSDDGVLRICN